MQNVPNPGSADRFGTGRRLTLEFAPNRRTASRFVAQCTLKPAHRTGWGTAVLGQRRAGVVYRPATSISRASIDLAAGATPGPDIVTAVT
jgi:hypothetical protein